jgi:hypothetical protein
MGHRDDDVLAPDGATRLGRGAAVASAAVAVALAGHVAAGGAVPGPAGVLVPLLLAIPVCAVVSGLRLPWLRLVLSVALSQALFHLLFTLGAPGAPGVASTLDGATGTAGHPHTEHAAALDALTTSGHALHADGPMTVAHLLAGLVTVALLRSGEVALHRAARALRRIVLRLLPALPASAPTGTARRTRPARAHGDVPATSVLLTAADVVRRGPPRTPAPLPP